MNKAENENDRSPHMNEDHFDERIRKNVTAESVQARVIERESELLAKTFDELKKSGDVSRAATLVLGGRRRYVAGEGKAAAYAQLLGSDLSAVLSNVFLVDGRSLTPLTVLSDVRSTDVLVVFSFRRYREESIRFGRLFVEAGGQLVVITDHRESPLARIAAATIRVYTNSASFSDSPIGVAAVCHLLSTLTATSAKGARRRRSMRDRYAMELGLYPKQKA